ncbi:MAG: prepilin peptidase [Lachnospiraceae bacterium]|nr:prepilin peptidase [Lachnospiraceae bacterium]
MVLFELSELEPWMVAYFVVLAFILGNVFGSFLNCAAWRIAHNMSFMRGHSICPKCKHELGARDLIPIVSYVTSRGRCRYCKEPISIRYPVTEIIFGLVSVAMLVSDGVSLLYLRDFVFASCLFCLSLVDLEIFEIPNGTLIVAIIAWVVSVPFINADITYILMHVGAAFGFAVGFLVLSLVMDKILGRDSLGGGDIKLFFVVGLYLGAVAGMFTVILAAIVALGFARGRERIPFGPFISIAAWVMLIFGNPVVQWYLDMIQI